MRQPWLWAIVVGIAALSWGTLIQQVGRGNPVGDNPMSDWGVVVLWALAGLGLPLLFWRGGMTTRVYPAGVVICWMPFTRREVSTGEIAGVRARTYKPLREFGGWGIRGFSGNRAYNVSGDTAVELMLTDHRRVTIGTQRPRELEAAILAIIEPDGAAADPRPGVA